MTFPEFSYTASLHARAQKIAKTLRPRFDELVRHLPAFADYVRSHPFIPSEHAKKRRRARLKDRALWKKHTIERFVDTHGLSRFPELHAFCGFAMPWWARAMLERHERKLPLAA